MTKWPVQKLKPTHRYPFQQINKLNRRISHLTSRPSSKMDLTCVVDYHYLYIMTIVAREYENKSVVCLDHIEYDPCA